NAICTILPGRPLQSSRPADTIVRTVTRVAAELRQISASLTHPTNIIIRAEALKPGCGANRGTAFIIAVYRTTGEGGRLAEIVTRNSDPGAVDCRVSAIKTGSPGWPDRALGALSPRCAS